MNIFQAQRNPNVPRNTFDLSHDRKFTVDFGELAPMGVWETYPGDLWKINCQVLAKTLALVSPVMHLIEIDVHFYKAPTRIMYPDFDDIIAPPDPDDTPPLAATFQSVNDIAVGDLGDYLGLPIDSHANHATALEVIAYPVAMYTMIYDYWYRDQNLQAEVTQDLVGGPNSWVTVAARDPLLKRAWPHDYFTSNLPFAQKGDVVTLPVVEAGSGAVDVVSKGAGNVGGHIVRGVSDFVAATADDMVIAGAGEIHVGAQGEHTIDPNGDWEVQLNDVAQDIITVRTAFKVQEFLELDARAGTRYKEVVYAHFDVQTKDGRLQEPEYIGGQKSQLRISDVLSTAQTLDSSNNVVSPVGERTGQGISVDGGKTITTYCREHGFIMPIFSARPRTAYSQGVPRMWFRHERMDYPWPSLAHIGEQPVYTKELYCAMSDSAKLDTVFGYIPRYSELKFIPSSFAGLMRTTFDYWHLGRKFTTEPALNSDFIECNPDKRIFAVTTEPALMVHAIFNISCTRNFPMFSTPKL